MATLCVGSALANSGANPDATAYWQAALRLRAGQALYFVPANIEQVDVYRYAPWFALLWLPLTYLPQAVALALWRGVLLIGIGLAVLPAARSRTLAGTILAIVIGSFLLGAVPGGNVTPLLIGLAATTLPTRGGPVALGIAASLKVYPLLLVSGYVADRRWGAVAVAVATTLGLWIPALFLGWTPLLAQPGSGGESLYALARGLWPLGVIAACSMIGILIARRSRWTFLATAASLLVVVPRVWAADAAWSITALAYPRLRRPAPSPPQAGRVS